LILLSIIQLLNSEKVHNAYQSFGLWAYTRLLKLADLCNTTQLEKKVDIANKSLINAKV